MQSPTQRPVPTVLGIDGGGTKTDLWLAAPGGHRKTRVGGSSLARREREAVFEELERGLQALEADAIQAVCGGFASAGRNTDEYHAMLTALCPGAAVLVVTDAEIAWQGAFGGGDGIVVIAGTGSIAWGRYRGRTARAGGTQPGRDPGSGDWMAATGATAEATACELAQLLADCAAQLHWKLPWAAAVGGVFEHRGDVLAALQRAWPHELRPPLASPVEGALALATRLGAC